MSAFDKYLGLGGGDPQTAAAMLADDLMKGDPATFKSGYSPENAARAAAGIFGLSADEAEDLARDIEDGLTERAETSQ